MILTSTLPQSQKERFKAWADKFEALNKMRPPVLTKCHICEQSMCVTHRESLTLNLKPVCSDECKKDLNALILFLDYD